MMYVAVLYTKKAPNLVSSDDVKYIFINCNSAHNIFDLSGMSLNGYIVADKGVSHYDQDFARCSIRL